MRTLTRGRSSLCHSFALQTAQRAWIAHVAPQLGLVKSAHQVTPAADSSHSFIITLGSAPRAEKAGDCCASQIGAAPGDVAQALLQVKILERTGAPVLCEHFQ